MVLRYGSEAKIDLLTIDGAPGGTGMSPWPMMKEWGIPTFHWCRYIYASDTNRYPPFGTIISNLAH
ncbi:glutamate synthase-related protein [Methanosphaerula palustris]|uniref:glutamate synthase-related protein n=1 Tax=Methanosphaerula palustris TaxID=475088 RepID=UPI0001848C07